MAGRGRAALTRKSGGRSAVENEPRPLLYTAQDLARFCEVDLKTIHHWADGGKIPHHRTEGRHLRFRRNHVLAFLRHHGYPLAAELASARPTILLAGPRRDRETGAAEETSWSEMAKKLTPRFAVRRFEHALAAIAHLVALEPDVVIASFDDPTWSGRRAIEALKSQPETSWIALVVVTDDASGAAAREAKEAGADLVIGISDMARLSGELTRTLAVD